MSDDVMAEWFHQEGAHVAACATGARTVHCGVVHPVPELRAYSMSALCMGYRKPDGTRLAYHERHGSPQLVRNFRLPWVDFAYGGRGMGRPVCRHCVVMWERKVEREADLIVAVEAAEALEAM